MARSIYNRILTAKRVAGSIVVPNAVSVRASAGTRSVKESSRFMKFFVELDDCESLGVKVCEPSDFAALGGFNIPNDADYNLHFGLTANCLLASLYRLETHLEN